MSKKESVQKLVNFLNNYTLINRSIDCCYNCSHWAYNNGGVYSMNMSRCNRKKNRKNKTQAVHICAKFRRCR